MHRTVGLSAALALSGLLACATSTPAPEAAPAAPAPAPVAPAVPSAATEPSPGLRLPKDVRPTAYRLSLDARPARDRFSGTVAIDVELEKPRQTIWLHARGIDAKRAQVSAGGATHAAKLLAPDREGMAALVLDAPVGPGKATLTIDYEAAYGTQNEAFYKVVSAGVPYLFTQYESIFARQSFPCFDEPGFKAPLTLDVTTDADLFVAANTPVAKEEPVSGGKRVQFKPTSPLPTYLYAWTVGAFDVVEAPPMAPNAQRAQPLPLRGIAPKGHGKELALALAETPKLVAALENYFGTAYPWEKLDIEAVPDFEAGAMENAGLITFRNQLLLLDEKASSIGNKKRMIDVTAHELAHQWFGDLVTLAWWDDVWLNEAFAEWLMTPISDEVRPELHFPLDALSESDHAMQMDVLKSARRIRQPIVTNGDIANAFDGITYNKGAAVIGAFERYLGHDTFRDGIRAYIQAHKYGNATVDDLLSSLNQVSGKDVATPFRTFLDQPGVPLVEMNPSCTKAGATVALHQKRYQAIGSEPLDAQTWQVPVCARYDQDGKPATACTLLSAADGTLELPAKKCPAYIQPNADSAGYYRWSLPGPWLSKLAKAKGLAERDRYAVAAGIRASYAAGATSAADTFATLEPTVRDPVPQIAEVYGELAEPVFQHVADASWRAALQKKIAKLYRPVVQQLGYEPKPGDDEATIERRTAAVEMLVGLAEDHAAQAEMAKRGKAYLGVGGDGQLHPDAVAPEFASMAVGEAIRSDLSLVEPTLQRFFTVRDERAHNHLFAGLNDQHDTATTAKMRALSLDPRLRVNEFMRPYRSQISDYRTFEAAWTDFQKNYDALTKRLPEQGQTYLPYMMVGSCSVEGAKQGEAFFAPRVAAFHGERSLAQALESTRLCAARADFARKTAKQYFTR